MKYAETQRSSAWLAEADPHKFRKFLENIKTKHPYDEDSWRQYFVNTALYNQIKLHLPSCVEIWTSSGMPGNRSTPREHLLNSYFTFNTFYYLESLFDNKGIVYDLGCGGNLFKPFANNLIGIDSFHSNADIDDMVDTDFVKGHQEYFKRVFAINSLHFVSLIKFKLTIENFYSMLKVGGKGFITFALANMVELTSEDDWYKIFGKSAEETTIYDVVAWIDSTIWALPYNYHIVDYCYFKERDYGQIIIGNPIDGNIRLVIER
jgi:hypothetical protein